MKQELINKFTQAYSDISPEQEDYIIESGLERWRGLDDEE